MTISRGTSAPSPAADLVFLEPSDPILEETGAKTSTEVTPHVRFKESKPRSWRLSLNYPWRIAARVAEQPPDRSGGTKVPHSDRPGGGIETAQMLPEDPRLWLDGEVMPGDGVDFFGLKIDSRTRLVRISYHHLSPDLGSIPMRLWLADESGNPLLSWSLAPDETGIDLQMLALVRPEPITVYFGIEAISAGGGPSASGPIPFSLVIERGAGAFGEPFPLLVSVPRFPQLDGGRTTVSGSIEYLPLSLGSFLTPLDEVGGISDLGAINASGGTRLGLGFSSNEASITVSPGVAVFRPLPTQGSAAVGGLLPAGPLIRGESDSPEPLPMVEEVSDPLLLVAEAKASGAEDQDTGEAIVESDPSISGGGDGGGVRTPIGDITTVPISPLGTPGLAIFAGPSGWPMMHAALRLSRRGVFNSSSASVAAPAALAAELAAIEAIPDPMPTPAEAGSQFFQSPLSSTGESAAPMRPRVLRTALLGVAVLTVGLLLPELTTDRPLLRHHLPRPLARWPWRRPRP